MHRLSPCKSCSDGGSEPRRSMAFLKTSAGMGNLWKNNDIYHLLSAYYLGTVRLPWVVSLNILGSLEKQLRLSTPPFY